MVVSLALVVLIEASRGASNISVAEVPTTDHVRFRFATRIGRPLRKLLTGCPDVEVTFIAAIALVAASHGSGE